MEPGLSSPVFCGTKGGSAKETKDDRLFLDNQKFTK